VLVRQERVIVRFPPVADEHAPLPLNMPVPCSESVVPDAGRIAEAPIRALIWVVAVSPPPQPSVPLQIIVPPQQVELPAEPAESALLVISLENPFDWYRTQSPHWTALAPPTPKNAPVRLPPEQDSAPLISSPIVTALDQSASMLAGA